ncbi:MAG: hypothetical protein CMI55_01820, partial [Parcubacteria group bacterium]|nr:hypothetical protein [Parcubacteria group bacterium]
MWYQGGSKAKYLTHTDAKAWVKKQNRRGYAGFIDWRLPTLEEAASLLESSKKEGLCIDPIFSKDQEWIWTGDRRGNGEAWRISFSLGGLCGTSINNTPRSIRPVRTWKTLETDRESISEKHSETIHKQSTIVQKDSNTTPDNLRTNYKELSIVQVKAIPNISIRNDKDMNWGFSAHSTIDHNYEVKSINGNKLVTDHTSGLLWHQNGSKRGMNWEEANKWIEKLNRQGYAGYHDWRLPTVEEAVSLIEPKKYKKRVINPIFDVKQPVIWTGNKEYGSEGHWFVNFPFGFVNSTNEDFPFVRPVRSIAGIQKSLGNDKTEETEKFTEIVIQYKDGSIPKAFPRGTKLKLEYFDGVEFQDKIIRIRRKSRTSERKILKIFNEHFKDYGHKFTLELELLKHRNLSAFNFKKTTLRRSDRKFLVERYKKEIKINTPYETGLKHITIDDYKHKFDGDYCYIYTDLSSSELEEGHNYVNFKGYERFYFKGKDDLMALPQLDNIHITTLGDNLPVNTEIKLYCKADGCNVKAAPLVYTDMESRIKGRRKFLDKIKRNYHACGKHFELTVTDHDSLPKDIFRPYYFSGKGFPPSEINFKQYKYAKIEKPEDDSEGIIAAAENKGYKVEKKGGYIYIWKFDGDLKGEFLAFNKNYEPLKLDYFENKDDFLIPEKAIKQIKLLQNKNKAFPSETTFTINLNCKHSTIEDQDFKLDSDSTVPQKVIRDTIKGHYANASSFTLKVNSHPELPPDIFKEFKFPTGKQNPPDIKAVFKQHEYAKVEWPQSEEKGLERMASNEGKYTIKDW